MSLKKPSTSVLKQAATPEESLVELSRGVGPLKLPKGVSRDHFVGELLSVYELMGGQSRLLLWADEHPTEFYKLMFKTTPKQDLSGQQQLGSFSINLHIAQPPGSPKAVN